MMDTIVVGYDESDASRRALERAAMLAKALQSTLIVTSASPVAASPGRSLGADPVDDAAAELAHLAAARKYLDERGQAAQYVEAFGSAAQSLVSVADEKSADLIVVGAGERAMLERLFGGAVSDTVAHRAHCDVLIVH
jgi:nucleotide-binding universal stress UspA family protein